MKMNALTLPSAQVKILRVGVSYPHGIIAQIYPNLYKLPRSAFQNSTMQCNAALLPGGGQITDKRINMNLSELKSTPYYLLPPNRPLFSQLNSVPEFIPAVIPPFGDQKERAMFGLDTIWEQVESALSRANELVIIGCSIREEDNLLRDVLQNNLRDNVTIHIACGSQSSDLQKEFEEWLTNPTIYTHRYFKDFLNDIDA